MPLTRRMKVGGTLCAAIFFRNQTFQVVAGTAPKHAIQRSGLKLRESKFALRSSVILR